MDNIQNFSSYTERTPFCFLSEQKFGTFESQNQSLCQNDISVAKLFLRNTLSSMMILIMMVILIIMNLYGSNITALTSEYKVSNIRKLKTPWL
jgi:hypothetical protein